MYYEFIEKCKQRILEENIYTEKHHIIPRCMGGKDEDENLIILTAQEHYEAHKLLALENPEHSGLQIAWWNMCHCQSHGREYDVSAEEYAEAKERNAKILSEKYKGRPSTHPEDWSPSEETRRKISESEKGKIIPQELKDRWSRQRKGIPMKQENKEKRYKKALCVELNIVFKSYMEAGNFIDRHPSQISRAIRTGTTAGGYHWRKIEC